MQKLTITQKPGEPYPTILFDGEKTAMLIQNLKLEFDTDMTGGFATLRVYVPEIEVDMADVAFTVVDQNDNPVADVPDGDPA